MRETIAKTFRLSGEGLSKVLGPLEEEVMNVLWKRNDASGKDVLSEIKRHRDIAYTTVLTVLERLTIKGLVEKRREDGNYTFSPVYSREEFSRTVSKEVLKGVIDLSASNTLASFVDILANKDPLSLEKLSSLIESKKRELGKG
ncbi:MAG: BlaI/MecI/CopY family transcriptional regulator [Deltaproteobacteria bacterium]|nr:BlaI/MecI/CopY family transcriptional regulator [Deltaproteobacteria bacterium]